LNTNITESTVSVIL